ncbi:MAG: MATE family efflux transporter [Tannerellaceae bacterium]|nr:MATE family efflux transporter [Tannerellaceae bacterium]
MNNEITHKLEHEKTGRLLLQYAIPAVIGTLINSLYNIVDRIFIGQGVGPYAISGLTLTFPIFLFLQAFGMLVGAGAAARISIYLGRKETHKAERILGNAFVLILILSTLTILPCMLFMEELLVLFGGSERTIPYAADYLYITVPGNLFASLSFGFNAMMRASGYPRKAMFTMIIGAVLNILLDALFILVLDMGIQGAAIATIISMGVSAGYVLSHFIDKKSLLHFTKKCFRLQREAIAGIVTIGISPFSMQMAASLVSVFLNYSLKLYGGDLAIGANGIINSVALLNIMLIVGIAQGMQPIVGYNYGAGNQKRVLQTLKLVVITATCVTGLGWVVSQLFPTLIVVAFTVDPDLIEISANGLKLCLSAFLVVGSQIVISQFFQSIGMAWKSIFLSLSRQVLFLLPAVILLPPFLGLDGIWYASPLSDIMAASFAWIFLARHVKNMKNNAFR